MKCPHCSVAIFANVRYQDIATTHEGTWGTASQSCPACGRAIIELGQLQLKSRGLNGSSWEPIEGSFRLIHPRSISRSPVPTEVPPDTARDYGEASLVLQDSPKASAAISRRCLQHILRENAGVEKADLAREIQQVLDSRQLPTHLAENLDAVRNIGNFAAHPLKSINTGEIQHVEVGEADWLLDVIEQLFDFYFVQPARSKLKRATLDAKLQAAGKPPMKTPVP